MVTMPTDKKSFRMDFEQEIIDFDKKTGRIRAILKPNPERYEKRTISGRLCYYDKFDNVYIPLEEIGKAAKKIKNLKEVTELEFTIESWGQLEVKDIFIKAVEALEDNLKELEKAVK